jgi:hypothetical protein
MIGVRGLPRSKPQNLQVESDLLVLVIADNPIGESAYFPDSNKCSCVCPSEDWSARNLWITSTAKNEPQVPKLVLTHKLGEQLVKMVHAGFALRRVVAAIAPRRFDIHSGG